MWYPMIHLIGSLAVLQIFKKNNPLEKSRISQTVEEEDRDFQEQNEAIVAKLSAYDEQLNTCGYLVFRWWLKFVIVFDYTRIWFVVMYWIVTNSYIHWTLELTVLSFTFLISAWCALQTGVSFEIKSLEKVEKAIFWLRICIIVSVIIYPFFRDAPNQYLPVLSMNFADHRLLSYLLGFLGCCLLPILTLIGALKAKAIIIQRDKFAQVLTLNDESYLI